MGVGFLERRRRPSGAHRVDAWETIAEWATTQDVRPDVVVEALRDALAEGPEGIASGLIWDDPAPTVTPGEDDG